MILNRRKPDFDPEAGPVQALPHLDDRAGRSAIFLASDGSNCANDAELSVDGGMAQI
jgi:hypothetical protein